MIRSEIKCTLSRKIALFLAFTIFSLASFMILESISTVSFTFGQTGSLQANRSNSNLLSMNNENIIGDPFYTENTKSTNIKVLNIDPIPSVEVTYTGNSTMGGAPTQTIGTTIDKMNTDGTVSSNGQAIILTASGQVITYRSESIGAYNPDGSFSNSGVMVFHLPFKTDSTGSTGVSSNSTDTIYTQFDNLFGIYKKTVDPEGNGLTKVWKWK
jgi:hypothetical protein